MKFPGRLLARQLFCRVNALFFCLLLAPMQIQLPGAVPNPNAAEVLRKMDARAGHFSEVSLRIWEFAELSFEEFQSAALLRSELQAAGFQIQTNIAGMPTAFIASWGEGKPVIGLLGEYDALPELQQAAVAEKQPENKATPGHGCGHNLLGTAAALAENRGR